MSKRSGGGNCGMAVTFCEIFVNSLELVAFGDYKRPTLFARFRSILSGRDWVYLSGLLVPFVVYNLVLKGIRIDSQEELPGGFAAFALIRSDLLFNLGYVFLWVGLFALTRRSRLRWPVVVLFHTVTIVVIATTTSARSPRRWGSSFSRCRSVPGWPENRSPGTPWSISSCRRWSTRGSETSS